MMTECKKVIKVSGICLFSWLFAIAFAILVSCTGEEKEDTRFPVGKTAQFQLVLSGTTSGDTRATGGALPDQEATINRLTVGLFFADGSVNTIVEPGVIPDASGKVKTEKILCSPGTCEVIVVANVPEGTFSGVQNKNEFIGKTVGLVQTVRDGQQASDLLPMSGISAEKVVLEADKTVAVAVGLSRMVARISIVGIRADFGLEYSKATFTLDRVFLCNALEASRVSPGDVTQTMPAQPTWLHGGTVQEQPDGSFLWTKGAGFLLNDVTPEGGVVITNEEYKVPYWFYAFANNDPNNRTKLVISGYFDPDGSTGSKPKTYVYYPIVVNRSQAGTIITPSDPSQITGVGDGTIARNRDYRIKAVIKGDGETNPGEEVTASNLELTVSVDDWTLKIVQEVELN